jgi:hypothetical protein
LNGSQIVREFRSAAQKKVAGIIFKAIILFTLKLKVMPGTNRSIGGRGNEQGGPNMGNDISRNISREVQADDTTAPVTGDKNKNKKDQNSKINQEQKNQQQQEESENDLD